MQMEGRGDIGKTCNVESGIIEALINIFASSSVCQRNFLYMQLLHHFGSISFAILPAWPICSNRILGMRGSKLEPLLVVFLCRPLHVHFLRHKFGRQICPFSGGKLLFALNYRVCNRSQHAASQFQAKPAILAPLLPSCS